ncbi:SURF1 family protein [uncultured Abyssibacter sp.]|uniref:SURF1 family protein n=1 Tax=uncultured Abyssibacter sp. TaxID=2320202 RepID=UPI0032B12A19
MKPGRIFIAVLVILLTGVMGSAAVWQYGRGVDRGAELERVRSMGERPPRALTIEELSTVGSLVPVRLSGRFDADHQILLDNQTRDGQFGYHVWTLLESGAAAVLVDRGWIAGSSSRDELPVWQTPGGVVEVVGHLRALPQAGIATQGNPCPVRQWPARLHYPDAQTLECVLDRELSPGLFQLLPESDHGFARSVETPGLPPERHFAYAGQWAALTLALWVLTWIVWRRRER